MVQKAEENHSINIALYVVLILKNTGQKNSKRNYLVENSLDSSSSVSSISFVSLFLCCPHWDKVRANVKLIRSDVRGFGGETGTSDVQNKRETSQTESCPVIQKDTYM